VYTAALATCNIDPAALLNPAQAQAQAAAVCQPTCTLALTAATTGPCATPSDLVVRAQSVVLVQLLQGCAGGGNAMGPCSATQLATVGPPAPLPIRASGQMAELTGCGRLAGSGGYGLLRGW